MSWNYRVVKKGEEYGVYEVYYDDNGFPETTSQTPVAPTEITLKALKERLQLVLEALEKEILDHNTMKPIS